MGRLGPGTEVVPAKGQMRSSSRAPLRVRIGSFVNTARVRTFLKFMREAISHEKDRIEGLRRPERPRGRNETSC